MGFFKDFAKDMRTASEASKKAEAKAKADAVEAAAKRLAEFGPMYLYQGPHFVSLRHSETGEVQYLKGATATVESGEALESRITATRIVLTGVFALAWRKKSGGESWLTIQGPKFFWVQKVNRGDAAQARQFAARVNAEARKVN